MKQRTPPDRQPAILPRPFALNFFRNAIRFFYINPRVKRKLDCDRKKLPPQFVLLCNHPSGLDNLYAVDWLLPEHKLNFISNRYYFFKTALGRMLRKVGCIPKSLFTGDIESVKNCLRIAKAGGNIGIMADVRLSMYGQTEDVPDTTARFLKKLGLPVVVMHFDGSYMTKPKWAKDIRKGMILAKCYELFDSASLAAATDEEVTSKMREALYYDDFEWIKKHPEITFKAKKMAEGLENILYKCPHCGKEFCLKSKKDRFFCTSCGYEVRLNPRYTFLPQRGFPLYFENLRDWFKAQKAEIALAITDSDFCLSSPVLLKKRSKDGKTFLREAGRGTCTLSHGGLVYEGSADGENLRLEFKSSELYALSYLTGKGFQHFSGTDYFCFMPDEPLLSIKFYIAAELLGKMHGAKG